MAKPNKEKKEINKLKTENAELRNKINKLENALGIKKDKLIKARLVLKNKRQLEQNKKINQLKSILRNNYDINKTDLASSLNISRVTLNKYLKIINEFYKN